jgi:hypothetical protein
MKPDFGKPKSQVCLLAKANKQTLPSPDVPSGASLISRRFTTNGGAFAFAKFLHLRGIYPTPQMGLHWQDFLLSRPV